MKSTNLSAISASRMSGNHCGAQVEQRVNSALALWGELHCCVRACAVLLRESLRCAAAGELALCGCGRALLCGGGARLRRHGETSPRYPPPQHTIPQTTPSVIPPPSGNSNLHSNCEGDSAHTRRPVVGKMPASPASKLTEKQSAPGTHPAHATSSCSCS